MDVGSAPEAGRTTDWSPSQVGWAGAPQVEWAGAPQVEWAWPPEAPWHPAEGSRFTTDEWAPPSTVRRPWVRVGRWTLLYRRPAA